MIGSGACRIEVHNSGPELNWEDSLGESGHYEKLVHCLQA